MFDKLAYGIEYYHRTGKSSTRTLRTKILEFLGNQCKNCGQNEIRVLEVDHVNNDGYLYKNKYKRRHGLYREILKTENNTDFQLLCRNCNWLKYLLQKLQVENISRALKSYRKFRNLCLEGYGSICERCGIKDKRILDLDHIFQNGAEHRRKVYSRGVYREIVADNFPSEYRVCCRNCNWLYYLERPKIK